MTLSTKFFKRSKQLVNTMNLVTLGSLPTVQYLILMAQYLMSLNEANLCSNVMALAISISKRLGLPFPYQDSNDPIERQNRARVWSACIATDAAAAATLGTPPHIYPEIDCKDSNLPLPIDEIYFDGNQVTPSPEPVPSQITFLIHTTKLFTLWLEILCKFGGPKAHFNVPPDMAFTLEFDRKLNHWLETLPENLNPNASIERSGAVNWLQMQANVMRLR